MTAYPYSPSQPPWPAGIRRAESDVLRTPLAHAEGRKGRGRAARRFGGRPGDGSGRWPGIRRPWIRLWLGLVLGGLLAAPGVSQEGRNDIWLVIDTELHLLDVMRGDDLELTFDNISIGRGGSAWERRRGDRKTPLGNFHIAWVNDQSRFYRFFGLDYPSPDHADRAFKAGRLSREARDAVERAYSAGVPPPQNTPLGGFIGIHGVGAGNPVIHDNVNWTDGCIALTNEQIDQLSRWVRVGTPVIIR